MELRCSPPDRPPLPADRLDLVFCANTLNEVDDEDQPAFVKSLADGLVPGGRAAFVDWRPVPMRLGPKPGDRI